jgi:TRAP transporter TAXI family solute receptor
MVLRAAFVLVVLVASSWTLAAQAQQAAPPSARQVEAAQQNAQRSAAQSPQQDAILRKQVNQGTVGIISGGVNGTYIRIAADLAAVLDSGNELRVLPIIGKGSVQNITDLLFLRGVDVGIVQSDVLTYMREQKPYAGIEKRIRYITKLYNEEFHLLAGKGIEKVDDLAGKKVNIDNVGSGTAMTATTVFKILGLAVEPTNFDQALAVEKVKSGEIAAMVYVAGKPAELFRKLEATEGLHLLAIAPSPALLETYLPSSLSHKDYPQLIADGTEVQTLAVGAVMAVYGWEPKTERHEKVARFVNAFFDNFASFLKAPRHPKWQEVNLAAIVPGWTRFDVAENWLNTRAAVTGPGYDLELRNTFEAFLKFMAEKKAIGQPRTLSEQERAALFSQFLQWQTQQGQQAQPAPQAQPAR